MSSTSRRAISFEANVEESLKEIMQFRTLRQSKQVPPFISDTLADQLSDISESENDGNHTQDNCTDFTAHGRCLGNHPTMNITLNQTLNQTKNLADSNFNETLNGALTNVGKLDWKHQLSKAPQWMAELWLKKCPKACEDKGVPVLKDAVGNQLNNMINLSMAQRPSAIEKRLTSSVRVVPSSLPTTSNVHTTRVRIQHHSPSTSTVFHFPITSLVADPANLSLEHWCLKRFGFNEISVAGRNVRNRMLTRSGPVERSLSPRRVVTRDGVIYNLIGPIDNEDEDMPDNIAKSFESGFPRNWKSLTKKWSNSLDSDNEENEIAVSPKSKRRTSTPKKSTPTKATQSKAKGATARDKDGFVVPAATARNRGALSLKKSPLKRTTKPKTSTNKTAAQSSRNSSTPEKGGTENRSLTSPCSVPVKKLDAKEISAMLLAPDNKRNPSPKKNKRTLIKWKPVLGETLDELKVAGCLTEGKTVLENNHVSSSISKRLEANQLETELGVLYVLSGPPHLPITHNGVVHMPTEIREKFVTGFPVNWRGVIKDWHHLLKLVRNPVNNGQTKATKVNNTREISQNHVVKGKKKKDLNSKDIAGVVLATTRKGRKVLKPLKYWENEKLILDGRKTFCRKGNDYILLNGSNLDTSASSEGSSMETPVVKPPVKRKAANEKPPTKTKKVRMTKTTATKTAPVQKSQPKKRASPASKKAKADSTTTTKSRSTKAAAPKNGLKETVVKPARKPAQPKEFDQAAIIEILSKPVKNASQRNKKEEVLKQIQEKNSYVDQDLFMSACSGVSSEIDDFSDDAAWDAGSTSSVSSKMTTSDDDRMKYSYTPPSGRMNLLLKVKSPAHSSPYKQDDPFENLPKKLDHQSSAFIHRQLSSRPRNRLTKKQRDEQKAAAEESARISKMHYQCKDTGISKEEVSLANQLFNHMTSNVIVTDEKVTNYLRNSPDLHTKDDSESEVELYYSENEEQDIPVAF